MPIWFSLLSTDISYSVPLLSQGGRNPKKTMLTKQNLIERLVRIQRDLFALSPTL